MPTRILTTECPSSQQVMDDRRYRRWWPALGATAAILVVACGASNEAGSGIAAGPTASAMAPQSSDGEVAIDDLTYSREGVVLLHSDNSIMYPEALISGKLVIDEDCGLSIDDTAGGNGVIPLALPVSADFDSVEEPSDFEAGGESHQVGQEDQFAGGGYPTAGLPDELLGDCPNPNYWLTPGHSGD